MAMKDLPSNIRRFMKVQGITSKKLAEECGIGQVAMSHILNGKSEPRSSTFVKICRALNQNPEVLLADTREMKAIHFRTYKNMTAKEKAARTILICEVDTWLKDYKELEEYFGQEYDGKLPSFKYNSPEEAAVQIRKHFKMGSSCPIFSIFPHIEKLGVKIKLLPFHLNRIFGFSIEEDYGGPALIINTDDTISIERQIFTAAHELGHLILHTYEENLSDKKMEEKEKEADRFAAELMMPNDAFLHEWKRLEGFDWRQRVLEIKKIFRVSYKTVLKRIYDHLGSEASFNIFKEFASWYRTEYGHDLKDHYEPNALCADDEPEGFGKAISRSEYSRFQRLVKKALEESYITSSRAAGMLGVSLQDLDNLINAWDLPLE